jgi:hypothetical protein
LIAVPRTPDFQDFAKRLLKVIALVLLVPNFATAGPDKSGSAAVAQVREELWGFRPRCSALAREAGLRSRRAGLP